MKDIDAWWIDFMEGEMDPKVKKDLQTLLKNSRADQLLLKEYLWLREWIKASDTRIEWSEARQKKLHDRITQGACQFLGTRRVSSRRIIAVES